LDAQKKPNGIILVSRDITERKKAEEALRESEEKYRTILETIEEGYYEVDLTGNFTFVNDSLCRMMGYTKDELMGMNNRQYMNEETAEKVYQVFKRLYATGEPYEAFDWEITRKDGTKRFHDSSVSLIRNAKGECIGFRGIARDITERKQAEERLRLQGAALEAAANAIIITDHEGMIEWANPAFTMLTGYSHTEAVSRNPRQLIKSGEQNQAFYKNLWDTILAGKVWRGQIINRRKDGSLYTEEMTITPLRNERGEISRFIAIKQDITERKRAEETLHESEERFKELYDDAPVGYHEYDSEGRITRVNRTDLEMLGYTREEMVGHYIWEFNLDEEVVRQQVMEKLAGSRPPGQALERIYKRKDGTTFPVLIEDRLIPDGNGRISGIRCTIQDITDRKRAEENLKQSEENARQLAKENAVMAEIGRIISSTLDIDEVYGSFSEEVKKIIPFDRVLINIINIEKRTVRNVYIAGKELQDRNVKDVYPLEGSGNAEMVRTKSTLLIQTEDFNEYKNRFPMLLSTFQAGFRSIMNVPLFSKGKIIGGLLLRSHKPHAYTDRDVRLAERVASQIAGAVANAQLYAERIEAEKEREALQEQLRQSQKMEAIGQLAGGVAHDFNNILTVIKGYSQLSLTEMKEGDPFRGNVEEIRKASDRAADLTRQLLAFSRRQIMEMRVLDLNRLLQNLDKMLRRLIGEDIGLVTLLAEDLGRVKADPGQIEQMVMNLVVNARDAMLNGGKLTIETANVELDQAYARAHIAVKPGPYVMVSVSDTGVGMAPEVRDRVFEPFFTTKEKGKGTGLGLSTVYGIVKQSGGNIWVYSEPGKGTTFKIYLPCVEEPLEALKEKIMAGELPRGSETILIVEDEKEVLKLAGTILRRQGYHVVEAVSGEEALKVCKERKEPFHLLLTDVVMPQMSGRQLAEQLKQLCRNFRVLYMSGYTDNAITHHGVLDKGMNYLQKPFTVDALARKVREVLDK
jgi:PAS domain S-box-containing protein